MGCHSGRLAEGQRAGATVGVDFDTPEGIETHLQRIFARAADTNLTMPPVDAVTAEERRLLGDWIACGAPGLEEAVRLGAEPTDPGPDPGPGPDDPTPPTDDSCATDEDCEGECRGSRTGCVCVTRRQLNLCARPCESDEDCPTPPNGTTFQCGQDGTCARG